MTRFLTRGVVSALIASVCFWLATNGHKALAAYLSNPQVTENLFTVFGIVAALVAGVSDGIRRDNHPEATVAPKHDEDPYPGYDYDPLRGWVRTDDHA